MKLFDAHLDLAMNALEWNRDYTRPLAEIRARELGWTDKPDRGNGVISFEEMKNAGARICIATQIARYVEKSNPLPGWHSPAQAWAQTQGQLAWYQEMERQGYLTQLRDWHSLKAFWDQEEVSSIGYILSLEGADSIVSIDHLELAYAQGLRAVGPAHYGPGRYAFGTDSDGPLPKRGKELLKKMGELGIILDVTHLSDTCFWEALDVYEGPLWASHHLCRTLTPHNRQLSDDMIQAIFTRGGVIGLALDAWMIVPGWERGKSTPMSTGVSFEHVYQHLDHLAQLAGHLHQIGLGTDLDGGFGHEQTPVEMKQYGDLRLFSQLLQNKGYSSKAMEGIWGENWMNFLQKAWS